MDLPLNASPLTMLRRSAGLPVDVAAEKLHLSDLQLTYIEHHTLRIPARLMREYRELLLPAPTTTQATLFDLYPEVWS